MGKFGLKKEKLRGAIQYGGNKISMTKYLKIHHI